MSLKTTDRRFCGLHRLEILVLLIEHPQVLGAIGLQILIYRNEMQR